jgi:hypothetical protein
VICTGLRDFLKAVAMTACGFLQLLKGAEHERSID